MRIDSVSSVTLPLPDTRQGAPIAADPVLREKLEAQMDLLRYWGRVVEPGTPQPLPPLNSMSADERRKLEYQPASSLSEGQLTQLFGGDGWKLKELADKRSDLKVGDLTQLRDDPEGLEAVRTMMLERPDLQFSDLTKRRGDGGMMVDPAILHEPSKKVLLDRQDIKPLELTRMGASFASWLRNPAMAQEAYGYALDLLEVRRGIHPGELEQMMGSMVMSVGGAQNAQSAQGSAAVVDMFKSGTELLKKRPDLRPDEVGTMAQETGRLAGKQAGDEGPGLVAQAFRASTQTLARAPHLGVNDVVQTSRVMRKHFAGEDARATEDRVHAFETGLDLMADHPGLKAEHLDQMLTRAKAQQPGLSGIRLLNAFEGMGHAVNQGAARLDTLTDLRAPRGAQGDLKVDLFGHSEGVTQGPERPSRFPGPERESDQGGPRQGSERSASSRTPSRQRSLPPAAGGKDM